jgi:hypothetical protein
MPAYLNGITPVLVEVGAAWDLHIYKKLPLSWEVTELL